MKDYLIVFTENTSNLTNPRLYHEREKNLGNKSDSKRERSGLFLHVYDHAGRFDQTYGIRIFFQIKSKKKQELHVIQHAVSEIEIRNSKKNQQLRKPFFADISLIPLKQKTLTRIR